CRELHCSDSCTIQQPFCGVNVLGILAGEQCFDCGNSNCCEIGLECGEFVPCWAALSCYNQNAQADCQMLTTKGCELAANYMNCRNPQCSAICGGSASACP